MLSSRVSSTGGHNGEVMVAKKMSSIQRWPQSPVAGFNKNSIFFHVTTRTAINQLNTINLDMFTIGGIVYRGLYRS
jgi:hypothetical protein